MNITLRPDLQKRIHERIQNGEFESAEAMVEHALTFFLDHAGGEMDEEQFRDVKAAIDEARDQAERGAGVSLDEFDRSMRAKYGVSR